MKSLRSSISWSALAVAIAVTMVRAQTPRPIQQAAPPPLTVDFYALGPDGVAVSDLAPSDVIVKIDGRARPVRSLRLVKQSDVPSLDSAVPAPVVPPPFGTNNVAEVGRTFIVMVDDESFRPGRERPIHAAVKTFLGSLSRMDRVALWTMPHGGPKVDLTRSHDQVGQAVQLVAGHGPSRETGPDAACRTRTSLETIEQMLSRLVGGEGPTIVVVITSSMVGPRRDNAPNYAPGPCELMVEHFTRVGRAAAAARAHFFVVQAEDLVRDGPAPAARASIGSVAPVASGATENPLEGIEHLAGVTGGTPLSLVRTGEATLVMVSRATASYYSAVVDGVPSESEGTHQLDVDVSRSGVEVRTRSTLFVSKPATSKPLPRTPPEMVRAADSFTSLQMRVSGFSTLNSAGGQMRVIAAAEAVEPGVLFAALSAALFDDQGRMVAQSHAAPAELSQTPALAALIVPAGSYRLRVAATDAAGRTGAADVEVVAELVAAGPLRLSSLVLGLSRNGAFQPRLLFGSEPVAIAYLDLLGAEPGARIAAVLEVADTLDGPARSRSRLTIEPTSDPMRFRVQGAIPMGALPPGDYIARVLVGLEGQPGGRVVRAFRKGTAG